MLNNAVGDWHFGRLLKKKEIRIVDSLSLAQKPFLSMCGDPQNHIIDKSQP
jgi:hypothetical protein